MDDRTELLLVIREVHDRISDNLNGGFADSIPGHIQPLAKRAGQLSTLAGFTHPPIELFVSLHHVGVKIWPLDGPDGFCEGGWDKQALPPSVWTQALLRLKQWIRHLESGPPDETYLGLVLDRQRRTVTRKRAETLPIKLSELQWQALLLLVAARGETVPATKFRPPHYTGKIGSALRNVLNRLNDDLLPLDLSVIDRSLKDCTRM